MNLEDPMKILEKNQGDLCDDCGGVIGAGCSCPLDEFSECYKLQGKPAMVNQWATIFSGTLQEARDERERLKFFNLGWRGFRILKSVTCFYVVE